jgi:hypothetical protein
MTVLQQDFQNLLPWFPYPPHGSSHPDFAASIYAFLYLSESALYCNTSLKEMRIAFSGLKKQKKPINKIENTDYP